MALGSQQGVIDLCQSSNTALIDRQLITARGLLDDDLLAAGLTTPSTSNTLSHAVNNLAAALVATAPGEVDPRSNFKVDGFERSDGKGSQPDNFLIDYKTNLNKYLEINGVQYRVPLGVSVIGTAGRRVGTYEEQ